MQLCVRKEGGRRNRGGNRSRSLGHQPAVEPATLALLLLHLPCPSFRVPTTLTTFSALQHLSDFKFFKQCHTSSVIIMLSHLELLLCKTSITLAKLSETNSIRAIPNQSEKRFVSRLMEIGQRSIRLNPILST